MYIGVISMRYAKALLAYADEKGTEDTVYEEAGKTEGNEHTTAVLETLGAEQTQARPMVTTWAQIEEVLTGVVESCLGGADIQETLEAAKTEIEAIGM